MVLPPRHLPLDRTGRVTMNAGPCPLVAMILGLIALRWLDSRLRDPAPSSSIQGLADEPPKDQAIEKRRIQRLSLILRPA